MTVYQCVNNTLQEARERESTSGTTLGCASYLHEAWAVLNWLNHWSSEILNDITYLEIIPVAMANFLWKKRFEAKKIVFHCDNLAVVTILNSKTSKSERVMSLARPIVLWTLT